MTDAILGTTATIPALDGDVAVEVRPGMQSAEILTVKDRGVTRLRGAGRGDLKIGVQVVTPTKLYVEGARAHQAVRVVEEVAGARARHFQQGLFAQAARPVPRASAAPR